MIKYRLGLAIVSIDVDDANQWGKIQYEGENEVFVRDVRETLRYQGGMYGHLIGDATTPIDLRRAMNQPEMKRFRPKLIEGQEMIDRWKPNLPPGVKS